MPPSNRRDFLRLAGSASAVATAGLAGAPAVSAFGGQQLGLDAADLILTNGRIVTMDASDTVVSTVAIKDGRFQQVGGTPTRGPHTRILDLGGRTTIPGLIDNHNHIVLLGLRPGYDTRLERAASIADVQATLAAQAENVPPGQFLTAIGGWAPAQFAEKRLPTQAELDAAVSTHPVYVQVAFAGPSATNSAGRDFFTSRGIEVGPNGEIAGNQPSVAALNALRSIQTFQDQKRGTLDALAYGVGLGLTTHMDMGGFILPGSENSQTVFVADGAASFNPYSAYEPFLALHRESQLPARLRVNFLSMDQDAAIPMLTQRVLNAFRDFGDDLVKVAGLGEFITAWPLFGQQFPTNYEAACRLAAQRGWTYQQHTLSLREDQFAADTFEAVNRVHPIADLHWSVAHVPFIDSDTVNRLRNVGAGLALHGWRYLAGTSTQNGPPYRMILDSGIHAGAGSDAAQISPLNPWLNIYYMVTGRNSSGDQINGDQTVARAEALRMYTAANGWFSREEHLLGSVEVGKLADLAVLSADFLDESAVSDEQIKELTSVLTIVDGHVVHDAGMLRAAP